MFGLDFSQLEFMSLDKPECLESLILEKTGDEPLPIRILKTISNTTLQIWWATTVYCCLPLLFTLSWIFDVEGDIRRRDEQYQRGIIRQREWMNDPVVIARTLETRARTERENEEKLKMKMRRTLPWIAEFGDRNMSLLEVLEGEEEREEGKGGIDRQEGSRLMSLPFELREKIWEEVVGGYVIHIFYVQIYRRVQHSRCKDPGLQRRCGKFLKQKGAVDSWGQCDLLALLRSCRRMYMEGVRVLYQKNLFDFVKREDMFKLAITIPESHLEWIRAATWYNRGHGGWELWENHEDISWRDCHRRNSGDKQCKCLICVRRMVIRCDDIKRCHAMMLWNEREDDDDKWAALDISFEVPTEHT